MNATGKPMAAIDVADKELLAVGVPAWRFGEQEAFGEQCGVMLHGGRPQVWR
jgi:hypothetical protein